MPTTMRTSTRSTREKRSSRRLENLKRWREDPVAFVVQCIGATPDPWQVHALRQLRKHRRLSVAACHGVGKDALAAWAVLWVMTCFKDCKIPCTAPTGHQLYDLLWSEVAKWLAKMPPLYRTLFDLKKDRLERKTRPETWFAAARTARKENSEALQGFHADTILVVVDEASGVPPIIFEVLEGALTGPLWFCLLIGNPAQTTGYFFDSHYSDRERWTCLRIMAESAHDGGDLPAGVYTSARVSPEYVAAMAKKYGVGSNVFRVRVLGLFPTSEDDQVILLEWVEAARVREVPASWSPNHYVVVGLDVAMFGGDDSALLVRQGPLIFGMETWHGHDEHYTAGRAVAWCKRLLQLGKKPAYLFVDVCGVGHKVWKLLIANEWLERNGIDVIGVNAGAESPDPECARLRDALWWRGRKEFNPKFGNEFGEQPMFAEGLDPELVARLTGELATPKFGYAPGTLKIKVEGKDQLRDRGVGSPDLADAYLLTLPFEAGMPVPPKRKARDYGEGEEAGGGSLDQWMAS